MGRRRRKVTEADRAWKSNKSKDSVPSKCAMVDLEIELKRIEFKLVNKLRQETIHMI